MEPTERVSGDLGPFRGMKKFFDREYPIAGFINGLERCRIIAYEWYRVNKLVF